MTDHAPLYRGSPPAFSESLDDATGISRVDATDDRLFVALGCGFAILTVGHGVACALEAGHPAKGLVGFGIACVLSFVSEWFVVRRGSVSLVFRGDWVGIYRGGRLSNVVSREQVRPAAPRPHTRFDADDLDALRSKLGASKAILVTVVGLLFAAGLAAMGFGVSDKDESRLLLFWSAAVGVMSVMWLHGAIRMGVASRRVVLDDTRDPTGVMFPKSALERAERSSGAK